MRNLAIPMAENEGLVALLAEMLILVLTSKDRISYTKVVIETIATGTRSTNRMNVIREFDTVFYRFFANSILEVKVYINYDILEAQLMHIP
jgi:hypothetical protein